MPSIIESEDRGIFGDNRVSGILRGDMMDAGECSHCSRWISPWRYYINSVNALSQSYLPGSMCGSYVYSAPSFNTGSIVLVDRLRLIFSGEAACAVEDFFHSRGHSNKVLKLSVISRQNKPPRDIMQSLRKLIESRGGDSRVLDAPSPSSYLLVVPYYAEELCHVPLLCAECGKPDLYDDNIRSACLRRVSDPCDDIDFAFSPASQMVISRKFNELLSGLNLFGARMCDLAEHEKIIRESMPDCIVKICSAAERFM